MKVKCEYCGNYIQDTDAVCPHCGAPNNQMQRSASGVPKTIEELKAFCAARSLPLEKMRFFLGEDYREPRAYGLYRDRDGCVVVYKNKSDGSRVIRYRGTDEAYAVNEIYQKLKAEIAGQRSYQAKKSASRSYHPTQQYPASGSGARDRYKNPNNPYNSPSRSTTRRRKTKKPRVLTILIIVFAVCTMFYGMVHDDSPNRGYYNYHGTYYYNQNDDWYAYDDALSDWVLADDVDEELTSNYSDYYENSYYSSDYGIDSFSESDYYVPYSSSSSSDDSYSYSYSYDDDWDDDDDWSWSSSDWDSDWDSGSSDWDSDW